MLSPANPPPRDPFQQREAFEGALRELGWTPGRTNVIEYRYAEGNRDQSHQNGPGPCHLRHARRQVRGLAYQRNSIHDCRLGARIQAGIVDNRK